MFHRTGGRRPDHPDLYDQAPENRPNKDRQSGSTAWRHRCSSSLGRRRVASEFALCLDCGHACRRRWAGYCLRASRTGPHVVLAEGFVGDRRATWGTKSTRSPMSSPWSPGMRRGQVGRLTRGPRHGRLRRLFRSVRGCRHQVWSSLASSLTTVSARAMLAAMIAGQDNAMVLVGSYGTTATRQTTRSGLLSQRPVVGVENAFPEPPEHQAADRRGEGAASLEFR